MQQYLKSFQRFMPVRKTRVPTSPVRLIGTLIDEDGAVVVVYQYDDGDRPYAIDLGSFQIKFDTLDPLEMVDPNAPLKDRYKPVTKDKPE